MTETRELTREEAEARRRQRQPGPQVDPQRDAILAGKLPMPESPSTQTKVLTQQDVDGFRQATYDHQQATLSEQAEQRERRRLELWQQAAMLATFEVAGRTFRVRVPPEPVGAGGLEGGLSQHVGRLINAAQCWSFFRLETLTREELDEPGFVHGPVRQDGRMEACPCKTKSCTFRAEAMSWAGQFEQIVRQLGDLGLLVEEVPKT